MLLEFALQQWMLVAALLTLIALLVGLEMRGAAKSVSPRQLSELVNRQQGVVLDVRDKNDFRTGHIVDAINIPHTQIKDRIGELNAHKGKPVIVVCKLGQNAGLVARSLQQAGFAPVYKLGGGITEWQAEQLPLVKV
jgi:rhodanese-related sulfurtransferase